MDNTYNLTPEESHLLDILHNIDWGEVKVCVQNGKVTMAKVTLPAEIFGFEVVKTIKIKNSS